MGLHIDSMTFGCIIVSVGLLVDFLMHVLLRYYEVPGRTRQEKTQTTLTTMGASIFIGGLSTFLGILPLALGTSMVMRTVFLCLSSCVFLGKLGVRDLKLVGVCFVSNCKPFSYSNLLNCTA